MEAITLYRPTGITEYHLIKKYKKFPPRLPEQPIFYPVLNEEYAIKIARDWNAKNGHFGYVFKFEVSKEFLRNYAVQTVGDKSHQEYWIPAEDLEAFNNAIIGDIILLHIFESWVVYLLECSDKSIYTGITNNIDARLEKHNAGKASKYTRARLPVTLIKTFERANKSDALKLEAKIKKLTRKDKLTLTSAQILKDKKMHKKIKKIILSPPIIISGNGTSLWGKSDGKDYQIKHIEPHYLSDDDSDQEEIYTVSVFGKKINWWQYTDRQIAKEIRKKLMPILQEKLGCNIANMEWSEQGMQPKNGWNFDVFLKNKK